LLRRITLQQKDVIKKRVLFLVKKMMDMTEWFLRQIKRVKIE
jgi:hypothetical protein